MRKRSIVGVLIVFVAGFYAGQLFSTGNSIGPAHHVYSTPAGGVRLSFEAEAAKQALSKEASKLVGQAKDKPATAKADDATVKAASKKSATAPSVAAAAPVTAAKSAPGAPPTLPSPSSSSPPVKPAAAPDVPVVAKPPTIVADAPKNGREPSVCHDGPIIPNPNLAIACLTAEIQAIGAECSDDSCELLSDYKKYRELLQERQRLWDDVAFVVRTGMATMPKRYSSSETWCTRVGRCVYVADANMTTQYQSSNLKLTRVPPATDGAYKYGSAGDYSLKSKRGWDVDFTKHFGALAELYLARPNAKWYIMVDDDTYVMQGQLFRILSHFNHEAETHDRWLGACYGFGSELDACKEYQREDKKRVQFYASGGNGIIFSRFTFLKLLEKLPGCVDRYKSCWAGDRRLGACMYDVGNIRCSTDYINSDIGYIGSTEVDTVYSRNYTGTDYYLYSLHKLSSWVAQGINTIETDINKDNGFGPIHGLDTAPYHDVINVMTQPPLDHRWSHFRRLHAGAPDAVDADGATAAFAGTEAALEAEASAHDALMPWE